MSEPKNMTYSQAAAVRARLTRCRFCGASIPSLSRIVCPPCTVTHNVAAGGQTRGAR